MSVKVISDNTVKLRKALSGSALLPAARNAGLYVLSRARVLVPVDTGNLRSSLQVEDAEVTQNAAWVNVGTESVYANIQELGGVIKAKNAPFLRWVDKGGNWHAAKSVHIPAQPYLRPAVDENQSKIKNVVAAAIKKIIEANT